MLLFALQLVSDGPEEGLMLGVLGMLKKA